MEKKNVKIKMTAAELEYLIDLVTEDYNKAYEAASLEIDKENKNSNLINQLDRYANFVYELKDKLKSYEV
jgi:hypothetical protein